MGSLKVPRGNLVLSRLKFSIDIIFSDIVSLSPPPAFQSHVSTNVPEPTRSGKQTLSGRVRVSRHLTPTPTYLVVLGEIVGQKNRRSLNIFLLFLSLISIFSICFR